MSDLKQIIYFRQTSSLGPWYECEAGDIGAVAFVRRTQPEATAPAQDLSAAILALPKTGYSCAKRADDPINEFAACGKHCGDESTCPSHEQQSDATVGLTALIRQLLNSPSNSWQQQAAISLQAHREWVGIRAAILALQAGCPYGSANLAADMWKEGFEACREAAAALASSPANALSAGDRVDAELRNLTSAETHGDQSVLLTFASCRAAQAFKRAILKSQGGKNG